VRRKPPARGKRQARLTDMESYNAARLFDLDVKAFWNEFHFVTIHRVDQPGFHGSADNAGRPSGRPLYQYIRARIAGIAANSGVRRTLRRPYRSSGLNMLVKESGKRKRKDDVFNYRNYMPRGRA